MIPRQLQWFFRLAALAALTGVLVGPQAMVAAACTEPAESGHHQSHNGKRHPPMPQHCCDLCSVACSGTALHGTPGSLALPVAQTGYTAPGFLRWAEVVVWFRYLHPLALGPPAFHA